MRVLFTTAPLSGHFFPLVPLAWACRAAGHEVLVATAASYVPSVVRAGLPAAATAPPADFVELAAETTPELGVPGADVREVERRLRYGHGMVFGEMAASGLPGMTELIGQWYPDIIVSDRAEFAGPVAGARHDIPIVQLHWGVAELPEYRLGAEAVLGERLPDPTWVLDPWPRVLRLPHALPHHGIRHVPYNGDAPVPGWMLAPRAKPRICLTMGTLVPHIDVRGLAPLISETLENLADLGFDPVLVADEKAVAAWEPLPSVAEHVGRMPLSEVLRASDAVIHHGGQGTSLTALAAGLPQLVLPQFADQFENAAAIVRSGAGIRLRPEEISPETLAKGCLRLLENVSFGEGAASAAAAVAAQPSPAEIATSLEAIKDS
ncbi:L-noviosyl transferase [Amycolatopsis xylanica]|uniref:L-noviosyl transferase n=1 Tax=Amycolatopsis xylanica TaxID=589385 RepID=A0A1H3D5S8_9PSEU|nr:nucleotide disphospho-sugar-binding domain-containing protein [Amycolatopsis xylanica]SDX61761.1 L-noviosyl transferase [Amycolatopsis xylanica]